MLWVTIAGMALVTYALRSSFLLLPPGVVACAGGLLSRGGITKADRRPRQAAPWRARARFSGLGHPYPTPRRTLPVRRGRASPRRFHSWRVRRIPRPPGV